MPVSVHRNQFNAASTDAKPNAITLRVPQARVLAVLMPDNPADQPIDWPIVTRAQLTIRAGYQVGSGTITRALNGIREHGTCTSGDPHPGMLVLGLVEEITLDIEGVKEVNYRATATGVRTYQAYLIKQGGVLPQLRDADTCTNDRYRKPS